MYHSTVLISCLNLVYQYTSTPSVWHSEHTTRLDRTVDGTLVLHCTKRYIQPSALKGLQISPLYIAMKQINVRVPVNRAVNWSSELSNCVNICYNIRIQSLKTIVSPRGDKTNTFEIISLYPCTNKIEPRIERYQIFAGAYYYYYYSITIS